MNTRLRFVIGCMAVCLLGTTAVSAVSLTDIADSPHKKAIEFLQEQHIIDGYPDGTFHPENTVNRAELLKILVGSLGFTPTSERYSACFPDVTDQWFAPFVCFAKEKEWVGGYPDGTFQGGKTVNAAEAIKMIVIAFGYPQEASDGSDAGAWYLPYVLTATREGILPASIFALGVSNPMNRGDVSEILYRAIGGDKAALDEPQPPSGTSSTSSSSKSSSSQAYVPRHRNGDAVDVRVGTGSSSSHSITTPVITFAPIVKKYGDPDFILSPVSNSKGDFTFTSSNAFIATVGSNNVVTIKSAGTVTITGIQDAAGDYGIGYVTTTLTITKIPPKITFNAMAKAMGDAPFTLFVTSNSSGFFTFTSSNTSVATVSGNTVTIVGPGLTTITAVQGEYGNFASATEAATLSVSP